MAKLTAFDAAEYLDSPEAIAAYLTEALEEGSADAVAEAIGTVARARGMTEIADRSGMNRVNLYRALKAGGHPEFNTVLQVLRALNVRLRAEPGSAMVERAAECHAP